MLPVILLVGGAGTGKDTIAEMLEKRGGVSLALADPVKEIAKYLFDFTDEQLWGPSEMRNAPDSRYFINSKAWVEVYYRINSLEFTAFLRQTLMGLYPASSANNKLLLDSLYNLEIQTGENNITPRKVLQVIGTDWGRAVRNDLWVSCAQWRVLQHLYDGAKFVVVSDGRFLNEVLEFSKMGASIWKIESKRENKDTHISESGIKEISPYYFDHFIYNDHGHGLLGLESKVSGVFEQSFKESDVFLFN